MKQNERYVRHIILKEIGKLGQERLCNSSVALVGAGALGNACANLLARAGVGKIKIIDRDIVELTNLQRQCLYTEEDIGRAKAEALAMHLRKINSEIEIEEFLCDFNAGNGENLLKDVNLVLDCTDNLSTRFLINDICLKHKIPWVYAGVLATSGMTYNVMPHGPCFRCIFPNLPTTPLPTCETVGILNSVPVLFGTIQATEALKILLGKEPRKTLLFFDLWNFEVQEISVVKNKECKACAKGEFEFLEEQGEHVAKLCGSSAVYFLPAGKRKIEMEEIKRKIEGVGEVRQLGKVLSLKVESWEITLFPDGGAIIKGTDSVEVAKSVYAKYIGY